MHTGRCATFSSTLISPTGDVAPSNDEVEAASATEAIIVTPTASFGADDENPRLRQEKTVQVLKLER